MQIFFFFKVGIAKGDIISHFLFLCVSSSLRFASLHLCFLPQPTLVCPLGISSEHSPPFFFFFSIRVMNKRERGKQMNKEREYDEEGMRHCTEAVTLTESTEQCTRKQDPEQLQENIDLYLVLFSFLSLGVCRVIFLCTCLISCLSLHFLFIFLYFFIFFLQLFMRYVKRSTFCLCHGKEPLLEKLSTTSVQLMPLVSPIICLRQSMWVYFHPSIWKQISDSVWLGALSIKHLI